jgi:hypothetical protein
MRSRLVLALGLAFLVLQPAVMAEELVTRISLEDAGALGDADMGIRVAAVSPDGSDVLVGGMEGFARLISADEAGDRSKDVELVTGRNSTVHDIAWHPRGATALLVGDEGLAMRYASDDRSVTYVNGTFSVLGYELTSVVWRPSGDFAYVGASDGTVWKFAEHTGFERLEGHGTSAVTDLACHRNKNVCFVASMDDGIAVIDGDHTLTWIPDSSGQTWVGIDCTNAILNECVGFASGLLSRVIQINALNPRFSTVDPAMKLDLDVGEHIGVSPGHGGTALVHLAPLGIVRHDAMSGSAETVLMPADAAEWNEVIAGRSLAAVWETTLHNGFIITEFGNILSFTPATEEVETTIMDVLVLGAVAISVPGVILGLVYMNSPFLQRKYRELRFGKK